MVNEPRLVEVRSSSSSDDDYTKDHGYKSKIPKSTKNVTRSSIKDNIRVIDDNLFL